MAEQKNPFGEPIETCSEDPMTGFFRDGCCNTNYQDHGSHTVCAVMTEEFLQFSKSRGNDLSTPRPEFGFDGLNAGDRWCLCAARWLEAADAGYAPHVALRSCNESVLGIVEMEKLRKHAIDLN